MGLWGPEAAVTEEEDEDEEETRILHHLGIARNFLHSVHGMLVFGDRDEEGYHVQSSY